MTVDSSSVHSPTINPEDNPENVLRFMNMAIDQAELALNEGEVPVGCVFVSKDNVVIAKGHNKTNDTLNGTTHAELVAVNHAFFVDEQPANVFEESTLYVSCEPCIMCAAAIAKLKIKQVYFGCHNDRFGGNGSILSVHNDSLIKGHKYPVFAGIQKERAIETFQRFYESENRRAPEPKRRKKS
jgi:tRNA-specific adenosine deaminase 2